MKTVMVSPISNLLVKEVETDGWSWGAFLLGIIWYAMKGVWGKFWLYLLLSIVVASFTFGLGVVPLWLIMGFRFNKEHFESLLAKGYKIQTKKE